MACHGRSCTVVIGDGQGGFTTALKVKTGAAGRGFSYPGQRKRRKWGEEGRGMSLRAATVAEATTAAFLAAGFVGFRFGSLN